MIKRLSKYLNSSLQRRMFLGIIMPVTIVVGGLVLTHFFLARSTSYKTITERATRVGTMITNIIENDYMSGDLLRMQQSVTEVGEYEKLGTLNIIDQNKKYIAVYPDNTLMQTFYNGKSLPKNRVVIDTDEAIQITIPFRGGFEEPIGWVFVSYPLQAYYAQQSRELGIRIIIVLLVFFGLIFIIRRWSQHLSAPLIQLAGIVKKVGDGNLSIAVPVIETRDETGILAVGIRQMTEKLREARQQLLISHNLEKERLEQQNRVLSFEVTKNETGGMVGTSEGIRAVQYLIKQASQSDTTVLLTGETGVGKELVAKAIHNQSSRRAQPFIPINCGALNLNLIEAELFGAERGAYTGSVQQRKGMFELAHRGTIFLDEIGELPLQAQVKLLRVIQERKLQRLGSESLIPIDVRIIAATNKNLHKEMLEKSFREDLFGRLNVFPIHVPPLRERQEDIVLLIVHFLEKYRAKYKKGSLNISKDAVEALQHRPWLRNIRELEHMIERLVVLNEGKLIAASDIPAPERERKLQIVSSRDNHYIDQSNELLEASGADQRRHVLLVALQQNNWNITKSAQQLNTNRQRLYRLIEKYNITPLDAKYATYSGIQEHSTIQ